MSVYRPVGNRLLSIEEIEEKISLGEGEAVTDEMGIPLGMRGGELIPFEEVGINKPLLVEIRHLYTGRYPEGRVARLTPNDMLVTSAVRSLATYNASPKAVNFLKSGVRSNFNLRNPAAGEDGTPIVFYVPALTDPNSVIDIEIIFDKFDNRLLEGIGSAFFAAAGIPLFAAYSTHLIAAGAITKLAGNVGERLFDGKPSFSQTEAITFERGGSQKTLKGFHILTEAGFDDEREGYKFDYEQGRLINKIDHKEYKGQSPYVVISLDGRKNPIFNNFVATAASAALLEKFYHIDSGQKQQIDMLVDAVRLYNDVQYKREAEKIELQLENVDPKSDEYSHLAEKRDAYLANLVTDLFAK